jgi:hypothetical protein
MLNQVCKFLMVDARVEFTLVSGTHSCLTFIVSVAVHVEAACGIHVAMLTSILCTGLPQYCERILKQVGVAWWPRARGQTNQGPVCHTHYTSNSMDARAFRPHLHLLHRDPLSCCHFMVSQRHMCNLLFSRFSFAVRCSCEFS